MRMSDHVLRPCLTVDLFRCNQGTVSVYAQPYCIGWISCADIQQGGASKLTGSHAPVPGTLAHVK